MEPPLSSYFILLSLTIYSYFTNITTATISDYKHVNIRNPDFSIANKANGQAVKLSMQIRENNITMHMLFT
jgi:hypothetical protein